MTFNNDIQKTEKEIAVLQKKLELLKEIETHKSQPRMYFELETGFITNPGSLTRYQRARVIDTSKRVRIE